MFNGPTGYSGKLAYIREQMQARALVFMGLQETRGFQGAFSGHGLLRFGTAAASGQEGVELWANVEQPLGYWKQKPVYMEKTDFTVVHAEPSQLLLRVERHPWSFWICVAHAPHSGHTSDHRSNWWQTLTDLTGKVPVEHDLYVLIDANATTGSCDHEHVLHRDDSASCSTDDFRLWLEVTSMCLPSTGPAHTGRDFTWTSPDSHTQKRLDYVVVRKTALRTCVHSQVLEDFDLGNLQEDHAVVAAQFDHTMQAPVYKPTPPRRAYDRVAIRSATISKDSWFTEPLAWEQDVESRADQATERLHALLQQHCPRPRARPKKPQVSAEAWDLRTAKLSIRKRLRAVQQQLSRPCTTAARTFCAWKMVFYQDKLRTTASLLKACLKRTKQSLICEAMQHVTAVTPASDIIHAVKPFMGSSKPLQQGAAPLPMVKNEDGEVCISAEESLARWTRFFSQMEAGEEVSPQEQRSRWIENLRSFRSQATDKDICDLPSLASLERVLRRVAPRKAIGIDDIPPELCKYHAPLVARALYGLLVQVTIWSQEALIHKGGNLVMAYKGKGDRMECSEFRSLLISLHIAKALHRCLRDDQSTIYEQFLHRQQLGGRPRVPVQVGLHMVRAFQRHALRQKHSVGLAFLDLQEAFYRIVRPLVLGTPYRDQDIALLAQRMKMPATILHDLYELLRQDSAIDQSALPVHCRNYLRSLHTDTWFSVQGRGAVITTQAGTRPGDSFADVIFGYMMAVVLKKFEHELHTQGLISEVPMTESDDFFSPLCSTMTDFIGPTWMDDLCVCIRSPSASDLLSKSARSLSPLLDVCRQHGMSPNLGAGKTELLISAVGAGSRQVKSTFFTPGAPQKLTIIGEYDSSEIPVVGAYKHLGGVVHHCGDLRKEIRKRTAIAHTTFGKYRRLLFHNPAIGLGRRAELFQALILSRMLYGAESWSFSDKKTWKHYEAAVMQLYRRLLQLPGDAHITDLDLLAKTMLPSPQELLTRARLRYLGTLHACRAQVPWGLLLADHEWRDAVCEDLRWLWQQLCHNGDLPDPDLSTDKWRELLVYYPRHWKRLIRKASHHAILQRLNLSVVTAFHRNIMTHLEQLGDFACHPARAQEPVPEDIYGCLTCRRRCRNKAGEAAHMFRSHHCISGLRKLFDSTVCPSCLRDFHTFTKIKAHLRYHAPCRQHLATLPRVQQVAPGQGSKENDKLEERYDRIMPIMQAAGPRRADRPQAPFVDIHVDLEDSILTYIIEEPYTDDAVPRIVDVVQQHAVSWTQLKTTLQSIVDSYDDEAAEEGFCTWTVDQVRSSLEAVGHPDWWPFLATSTSSPSSSTSSTMTLWDYEQWCIDLYAHAKQSWKARQPIPRTFGRRRVLLRAFSGRRRPGDLQWFVEELERTFLKQHDFQLDVISLDIVIDEVLGDVVDEKSRRFWQGHIKDRHVIAFLGGPPCNTWSQARKHELASGRGPRVIRRSDAPWGLRSLKRKELLQIIEGNQLMGFSLESMAMLATTAGVGVLEHPALPEDPSDASIWAQPILRCIADLPGMRLIRANQGYHGAASMKPTDLLTLNIPCIERCLAQWAVTQRPPCFSSIGQDAHGRFKTAPLKEYPPSLCGGLAQALLVSIDQYEVDSSIFPPSSFLEACKKLHVTTFGAYIGPDTHRR
eukprot:Skav233132  [mRNA]  locus=scaffold792:175507:180444:- [translate_table: standard]